MNILTFMYYLHQCHSSPHNTSSSTFLLNCTNFNFYSRWTACSCSCSSHNSCYTLLVYFYSTKFHIFIHSTDSLHSWLFPLFFTGPIFLTFFLLIYTSNCNNYCWLPVPLNSMNFPCYPQYMQCVKQWELCQLNIN